MDRKTSTSITDASVQGDLFSFVVIAWILLVFFFWKFGYCSSIVLPVCDSPQVYKYSAAMG